MLLSTATIAWYPTPDPGCSKTLARTPSKAPKRCSSAAARATLAGFTCSRWCVIKIFLIVHVDKQMMDKDNPWAFIISSASPTIGLFWTLQLTSRLESWSAIFVFGSGTSCRAVTYEIVFSWGPWHGGNQDSNEFHFICIFICT